MEGKRERERERSLGGLFWDALYQSIATHTPSTRTTTIPICVVVLTEGGGERDRGGCNQERERERERAVQSSLHIDVDMSVFSFPLFLSSKKKSFLSPLFLSLFFIYFLFCLPNALLSLSLFLLLSPPRHTREERERESSSGPERTASYLPLPQ